MTVPETTNAPQGNTVDRIFQFANDGSESQSTPGIGIAGGNISGIRLPYRHYTGGSSD